MLWKDIEAAYRNIQYYLDGLASTIGHAARSGDIIEGWRNLMATFKERKRRGEDIAKKYRSLTGNDRYASAVDAIADILLAVAENESEATRILLAAEVDYRNVAETEQFLAEG